jgi:hypothetical protein
MPSTMKPSGEVMERSKQQWAAIVPAAVAKGSEAQCMHCIADAQKDIAAFYVETDRLRSIEVSALNRIQHLERSLRKIAELRYIEDASEPFDDALDIADAALATQENR